MNPQRSRKVGKATKLLVKGLEGHYVGIGIRMESMFSSFCFNEISGLKHFSGHPRLNMTCSLDERTECSSVVAGLKRVSRFPLQNAIRTRNVFVRSTNTTEHSIMEIKEKDSEQNSWLRIKENEETKIRTVTAN